MAITTSFCTQAKSDLLSGGHCALATVTPTGTTAASSTAVTALSSAAGLAVGMAISGAAIPAGTVIAAIPSTTTLTLSQAATAAGTAVTLTCSGDALKIVLIKATPTGTYGAATTNYSNVTGNADEVTNTAGTAYVAGGQALTTVSPVISGTTAFINFSPNPSWTSASFSASGCMIDNTNARLGTANQSLSVHDFGGNQTVSAGTFTVVMPNATSTTAIQRLS
jgi:hypothetical protein